MAGETETVTQGALPARPTCGGGCHRELEGRLACPGTGGKLAQGVEGSCTLVTNLFSELTCQMVEELLELDQRRW